MITKCLQGVYTKSLEALVFGKRVSIPAVSEDDEPRDPLSAGQLAQVMTQTRRANFVAAAPSHCASESVVSLSRA